MPPHRKLLSRTRQTRELYVGGTYEKLVYNWYINIFCMIALLIVFLAADEEKVI